MKTMLSTLCLLSLSWCLTSAEAAPAKPRGPQKSAPRRVPFLQKRRVMVETLRTLQLQRLVLLHVYKPNSPEVRIIDRQIAALRRQLNLPQPLFQLLSL